MCRGIPACVVLHTNFTMWGHQFYHFVAAPDEALLSETLFQLSDAGGTCILFLRCFGVARHGTQGTRWRYAPDFAEANKILPQMGNCIKPMNAPVVRACSRRVS